MVRPLRAAGRSIRHGALALLVVLLHVSLASAAVQRGIPLHFEPNQGQLAGDVRFAARAGGGTLFLLPGESRLVLPGRDATPLRMRWVGAPRDAQVVGETLLPGRVNHHRGTDPTRWRTDIPTYARIRYEQLYPGIDVAFYGKGGLVEHDLLVAPGADPNVAQLDLIGADSVAIDRHGDLVIQTGTRRVRLHAPVSYQDYDDGRRSVASRWKLDAPRRARVEVGAYDRKRPLVIDPAMRYATYFGGNGEDNGGGIHVDATGITIGGLTTSTDLPEQTSAGSFDSFVAKLDPTGTTLLHVTYVGGTGDDVQRDLVVDAAGDAYLFGETTSTDLPTTEGAFDRSCGADGACSGGHDAFVAKLAGADGTLVWATYLGGNGSDVAGKIALGGGSGPFVSGYTNSTDLPVTPGAYDTTCGTDGTCNETFEPDRMVRRDCFVAKLDADGAALDYATYLGGGAFDRCFGVAVDGTGRAIVAGSTFSADFPATSGAFDTTCGADGSCDAGDDAFAAMLSADGSALVYATFLGGSGNGDAAIDEYGWAVAADPSGRAWIVGQTDSADFPTPNGGDTSFGGGVHDAFVAELDATGASLAFSTYLGGSGADHALDVAVDALGRIHVSGDTTSSDFPQVAALAGPGNACAFCSSGFTEAFVTTLEPGGTNLTFSSFIGGSNSDYGSNLAVVDAMGADEPTLYVLGDAASTDFPSIHPLQAVHGIDPGGFANYDVFLVRIPEPGTALACGCAIASLTSAARRRRSRETSGQGGAEGDLRL